MLSGRALVSLQMYIDILYVNRYCVPMDDQRPISGAEKTFFGLGTGSGILVVSFILKVSNFTHNASSACCAHLHQV